MKRLILLLIVVLCLISCKRKVYVLNPGQYYEITEPTVINILVEDPDTGQWVSYDYEWPAASIIAFPKHYWPKNDAGAP